MNSVDEALLKYSKKYLLLNVPGIGNSGAMHWQSNWELTFPNIKRLSQKNWDSPDKDDWVAELGRLIKQNTDKPIVLITHSLGGGVAIHANELDKLQNVKGVFMVALPDIERDDFPKDCTGFVPMPKKALTIPGVMISSETDDWCSINVAEKWAEILKVPFINIGDKQHICGASEFETWEEGKRLLVEFLDSL